jgi:hypothetical protein
LTSEKQESSGSASPTFDRVEPSYPNLSVLAMPDTL